MPFVSVISFALKESKKKPELNGCIGLVKSLSEERVQVKVFLSYEITTEDAFTPKPLPSFFKLFLLKPEKLVVISEKDWKEDFTALFKEANLPASDWEQVMFQRFSVAEFKRFSTAIRRLTEIQNQFSNHRSSEEFLITGVWSNQVFGTSVLQSLPNLSPFQPQTFVFVEGLVSSPEFNGHVGVVDKRGPEHTDVLIFLGTPELLRSGQPLNPQQAFKTLELRDQNMRLLTEADWKVDHTLSTAEGTENVERTDLSETQQSDLDRIKNLIEALCGGDGRLLLSDPEIKLKGRLLGAWVHLNYGREGIVLACGYNSSENSNPYRYIELIWRGIGK